MAEEKVFIKLEDFRIRPEEISAYIATNVYNNSGDAKPAVCIYRKNSDIVVNLTFATVEARDHVVTLLDRVFDARSIYQWI